MAVVSIVIVIVVFMIVVSLFSQTEKIKNKKTKILAWQVMGF